MDAKNMSLDDLISKRGGRGGMRGGRGGFSRGGRGGFSRGGGQINRQGRGGFRPLPRGDRIGGGPRNQMVRPKMFQ